MNPRTITNCCVLLLTLVLARGASAQGARLQLDHLDKLAELSKETVDVEVDSSMLKETSGFLAGKGADSEKVQELLEDIRGIYVKSFQFDVPGAYTENDIELIRKQVAGSGWSRVVGVRGKQELTEIYFFRDRDVSGGLVVIAAQARQLTVVNIVGRVDLASLGAIAPMIPKLPGAIRKGLPK
jgi:hypothetical protein